MWNDWTTLQQVCFCIATFFSIVLVVQVILMLIGLGSEGDTEIDLSGDGDADVVVDTGSGIALFTLKGLIAFFAVGGWVGFMLGNSALHPLLVILIAVASGTVALIGVGFLMKWLMRLQQNGTMSYSNAVGKTGEVYLTIPAKCAGAGKVNVEIQGQLTEASAMTDSDEPIKTGAKVVVVRADSTTLYVEKIS